jgi:outer membrane protein insertion porin family
MRGPIVAAVLAVGVGLAARPAPARAQEPETVAPRVDSVAVEGNRRIARQSIVNTAAIPLHTPIGFRDLQRAIRALYATAQFDDIRILRETGPDSSEVLVIAVQERPLLARTTIRGVDKLSESSVRDRVDLPIGRPLDHGMVTRAVQRIDSLYQAEGYYLASVKPEIIPQDSDHVRVELTIDEGRRIAISAVRIEGAHGLAPRQVVHAMKTRPEGFWWFQRGEYDEDELRKDLEERIPAFYGSHGYVDFRVVRDTLLVDHENGKAVLDISVEEGQPYQIGTVTVEGNHAFSTEQILALNPFTGRRSGLRCLLHDCVGPSWFDQTKWDDATQKLRTEYSNDGYLYAQVEPRVTRVIPPDSNGIPVVNLKWVVDEGRPAIINKIEFVGNDVTYDRVIRDALFLIPGDVFSQERLIRSYQAISNLGYFEQPLPIPDTRKVNPDDPYSDIDLIFRVKEKHTGSVNFGASVGQGTGVGGFLGLDEPNLFGQGKKGHLQWQFGGNLNDFELSYTDPQLWESRVSGTISLHDTRTRYIIANLGTIATRGASIQFGLPLPNNRYARLFPSYAIEWERYSGQAQTLGGLPRCSQCMRSTLSLGFMYDTRTGLPFPVSGSMHTISLSTTGGILGGSANYQRLDLEGHWYAPAGQLGGTGGIGSGGVALVLGLTSKAGFVFGNSAPFFEQLYSMGGTQYGIPLRGYDEFSITPQGFNPAATTGAAVSTNSFGKSFFAATVEFGARFSQSVYADLFYDVGNVYATASAFNPTRLFRGAGFGVALVTPLGPIGIDLGYGFDRVNAAGQPAPGWKVHFKMGNVFQ